MDKIEKITWQRVFDINEWNSLPNQFVSEVSNSGGLDERYTVNFMAHHPHKFHGSYTFLVTEYSSGGGSPYTRNKIEAKYGVKDL